MTKLVSPSGLVSNTNCVRANRVHNVLGFDSEEITHVRFSNTGSRPLYGFESLRISMFDSTGNPIGKQGVIIKRQLQPMEAFSLSRDELAELVEAEWNGAATLVMDFPRDSLKLHNLNLVNGETFMNFSCYEEAQ